MKVCSTNDYIISLKRRLHFELEQLQNLAPSSIFGEQRHRHAGTSCDYSDVVGLAGCLRQQVPEVSTHSWLVWFDWSRLVGNISESPSKRTCGTEQGKGQELSRG